MRKLEADPFFAKLEEQGEEQVRTHLAWGSVYDERKTRLAREWLDRKAEERDRARERDEMEIAREAADAARDAADAARSANTRATIALIIAVITAIALIIDLALSWGQTNGGQIP